MIPCNSVLDDAKSYQCKNVIQSQWWCGHPHRNPLGRTKCKHHLLGNLFRDVWAALLKKSIQKGSLLVDITQKGPRQGIRQSAKVNLCTASISPKEEQQ